MAALSGRHLKGIEIGRGEHLTPIAIAVKRIGLQSAQPVTTHKEKNIAVKARPEETLSY